MPAEGLVEDDFFDQAASLRLQFDWFATQGKRCGAGDGPWDPRGGAPFLASADQVLSQPALWNFLETLRDWARERLGLGHASTPRLQAFASQVAPGPEPPAAAGAAAWRYIHSLATCAVPAPNVTFASRASGLFSVARGVVHPLEFNRLVAAPVSVAYLIAAGPPVPPGPVAPRGVDAFALVLEGLVW